MNYKYLHFFLSFCFFSVSNSAWSQVIPDNSLNTQVTNNQNNILINGGTQAGSNLFHSFKEFSVGEGQFAIFNNGLDIQNIFSRVTGRSISQINGLVNSQGAANLFLINPNGIVFGENGAIAVGGSFFATTANKVIFADGFEFNTNTLNNILTVSRPVGLGLNNPGQIIINGTGHQLRLATDNFFI